MVHHTQVAESIDSEHDKNEAVEHHETHHEGTLGHVMEAIRNAPSNAICRKVGMRLVGASEFEYPTGHWMTCNDWVIDPPNDDGS